MVGAGKRKLKKVLRPAEIQQSVRPMSHILKVKTGISGSSVFETEARTSGYGADKGVGIKKVGLKINERDLQSSSLLKLLRRLTRFEVLRI